MSLGCDYLAPAIARARVVVAEINAQAPWAFGSHAWTQDDIDFAIHTDRPPLCAPLSRAQPTDSAIARHVASLIEDGSTLQVGIGSLPEAILAQLSDRRDLGV